MTTLLADTRKPRVIIVKTGETYPQIRKCCGDFESWFVRGLSSVARWVTILKAVKVALIPLHLKSQPQVTLCLAPCPPSFQPS